MRSDERTNVLDGLEMSKEAEEPEAASAKAAGTAKVERRKANPEAAGSGEASEPRALGDEGPFSRLERIWGTEGLARVAASKVMVIGLGGVGSSCAEALARGGVGRLVLVDCDVVQPSNINRQAIAFYSTIGRRKTDVARAMVADINPSAEVQVVDKFLYANDAPGLLETYAHDADFVVDAIDTVSTKLALAQHAECAGIRLISSMGGANKLHPECLRAADLYETTNCPLCRVMRKEGRARGIRHLQVLYSCEQPVRAQRRGDVDARDRSNLGTASFMPPIMGQMLAGVVLREIAGVEGGAN